MRGSSPIAFVGSDVHTTSCLACDPNANGGRVVWDSYKRRQFRNGVAGVGHCQRGLRPPIIQVADMAGNQVAGAPSLMNRPVQSGCAVASHGGGAL